MQPVLLLLAFAIADVQALTSTSKTSSAAKEVQQHEAENAEGRWASDPRSVEDFERLLLTQGDTSIVWIRYMAFHLKMSDLERARQVAERAVKHVGFAEGKERFNVWVAFMNLECTFGTEESVDAVFRRASSHNDAKQVHLQLARIHERSQKLQLAAKVYEACGKGHRRGSQHCAATSKLPLSILCILEQNDVLYRAAIDIGHNMSNFLCIEKYNGPTDFHVLKCQGTGSG